MARFLGKGKLKYRRFQKSIGERVLQDKVKFLILALYFGIILQKTKRKLQGKI